jgi:hypothetical protein
MHKRRRNSGHPHTWGRGEATHRLHRSQPPTTGLSAQGSNDDGYGHILLSDALTRHQSSAATQAMHVFAPHPLDTTARRAYRHGSVPKPTRYQRHLMLAIQGTSSNTLWRVPRLCAFHLMFRCQYTDTGGRGLSLAQRWFTPQPPPPLIEHALPLN